MRRQIVPEGFRTWWSTERQLRWRDIDTLGHLTAASYADLCQEACGDFAVEAWADADASYVVARLDISYLREIRREESPVRLHARLSRIGRSGFGVTMVVCSAAGKVCSIAEGSYVAWDAVCRRSRAMTDAERTGLMALGGQHLPGTTGT